MRQKSWTQKPAAEQVIKDARRATRKHHSAEDKKSWLGKSVQRG